MLDRETVAYIKASKQRGISDEIIRTELKKKDLSEKEITHALHLADSLLKENRPSHSESKDTSSHSSKQKSSRSEESTGWSWGAFILGPLFLLAIKKYYYLFLYLAYFIPFINFLAVFGIPIFLGIKGRELAYDSSMFETQHQASGFMSAVDHAGKIMFVVYLVGFVVAIIFFATFFSFLFSMVHVGGMPNHFSSPPIHVPPTIFMKK